MKPFFLHDQAWEELNRAIAHYETEREGLGQEFLAEVAFTIERILALA